MSMKSILKSSETLKANRIATYKAKFLLVISFLKLEIIKTMSNKFGLDIVFVLDLSNQKIGNIDCLAECIHLV
jgi:hypothetical protein